MQSKEEKKDPKKELETQFDEKTLNEMVKTSEDNKMIQLLLRQIKKLTIQNQFLAEELQNWKSEATQFLELNMKQSEAVIFDLKQKLIE